MRKFLIILLALLLSQACYAVVVDGFCYLEGQSDHSATKVKFIKVSPSAVTDSTYTEASGYFTKSLVPGIYHVEYTHTDFFTVTLQNQVFTSNTTLPTQYLELSIGLSGAFSGVLGPGYYRVAGDIWVDAANTLIIMPGTTLRYDGQYSFTIYGTLLAEGTAQDSIFFTTNTMYGPEWRGRLYFSGAPSSGSRLAYCLIRKGNVGDGGGVYCNQTSPTFANCTISSNLASNGGGLYCSQSSPSFTNCTISSNSASCGGGGYCWSSSPTFLNCTISGNSGYQGGGMHFREYSSPSFTYCTFTGNTADRGGGLYCNAFSSPTLSNCAISGNGASSEGGGVFCYYCSPTFSNCTISGNSANNGGGFYCHENSSATLTNCTVIGNSANYQGGGVYGRYSWPIFTNCNFIGNSANGTGGGMYCYGSSPIFNSTVIAFSIGSGIYFDGSPGSQILYCDIFGSSGGNIAFYNNDPSQGPPAIGWLLVTNANGDSADIYMNIFLDPLFADTSAGDYHLTVNSPCIDAGDPSLPLDPDETVADIGRFFFEQDLTLAPKSLQFGDVAVGGSSMLTTRLRNESSDPITIYSVTSSHPAFTHDFDPADSVLLPGDSLEIHVSFAPDSVGTFTGELMIVSNAPVNDTLSVALSGVGGLVPAPVTNLTITTEGANAMICWSPVDTTIYGNPVEVDAYLVYFAEACNGPFWFHGYTSDTCYTHSGAVQFADAMFYQVTAYVGSIGLLQKALAELGQHPKREDLDLRLQKPFAAKR